MVFVIVELFVVGVSQWNTVVRIVIAGKVGGVERVVQYVGTVDETTVERRLVALIVRIPAVVMTGWMSSDSASAVGAASGGEHAERGYDAQETLKYDDFQWNFLRLDFR